MTCEISAVEMRIDDRANLLERQPFGRGIDGQHAAFGRRALVVAQVDVFAWLELPAVVEAHRSGDEQRVALVDRPVEKGLAGP